MYEISRRSALKFLGVGAASVAIMGMVGCSGGSSSGSEDTDESDGVAPSVTVDLGLSPYGDELLGVAAINRGYFEEVGISFQSEYGDKVDLIKSATPLLNKQIEVGSGYPPSIASQLDNVQNIVGFAYSDVYYGYMILAPEGKYITLEQEMDAGASFEEALATVMEQLKGQEVLLRTGVASTFYNLLGEYGDTSMEDWDITYLTNDDILREAEAGNYEFVSPTGAVEIVRLMQEGWESLVNLSQAIEYMDDEDTIALRATFSGYLTTTEYAEDNYDTLLRFTSVMYRIIDDMEDDPEGTAADFVEYVNDYTGSSLTAAELAATFDGLYDLQNFEEADAMYNDETSDFYFDTVMTTNLQVLKEEGVLDGDYTADDLSIAKSIYNDLKNYKELTEEILADADSSDETVQQAQAYYDIRDYLDAYLVAKEL